MSDVRIGIAGATGYSGQELLRLAAAHPHAEPVLAMASAGGSGSRELPGLRGLWDGSVEPFSLDRLAEAADAVFLGLPDTASAEVAPALLARGARVFDLSGAFRLRDAAARQRWYPNTPEVGTPAVYGLAEWNRTPLAATRFVACPGCYPTAALLALKPLVAAGLVPPEADVHIDAKSGDLRRRQEAQRADALLRDSRKRRRLRSLRHRHAAEIEQELGRAVTFVPHLVPLDRGILETIYTRVRPGTTADEVGEAFEAAYADRPFVRLSADRLPEIKHVAHTNFCDIGWRVDAGRVVLVACLDNLGKGAAGQALQCFNVAYGFDERAGLIA